MHLKFYRIWCDSTENIILLVGYAYVTVRGKIQEEEFKKALMLLLYDDKNKALQKLSVLRREIKL